MDYTKAMTDAALSWLKYERNCDIVCTEYGTWPKDACGIIFGNDGLPLTMFEIEVKISRADLQADFRNKTKKHECYDKKIDCPNYMYYLVTEEMADYAKDFLQDKNPCYGLMQFNREKYLDSYNCLWVHKSLESVKRCRRLTDKRPLPRVVRGMTRRLQNEYLLQRLAISQFSSIHDKIQQFAKEIEQCT